MIHRHLICAAALTTFAATLPAQNCLGGPKSPQRHNLGILYTGPQGAAGDDGGAGVTFGMMTATEQTARVEFVYKPVIVDGSSSTDEDFAYTRLAGTLARPLGSPKQATTTGAMSGLCGMAQFATTIKSSISTEDELGRAPTSPTNAYSIAGGAAYAFSSPMAGVYAGPLLGISSADGETAMFATMHVGGGVQIGRIMLNAEMNAPLGIEGAKNFLEFRAGWMW